MSKFPPVLLVVCVLAAAGCAGSTGSACSTPPAATVEAVMQHAKSNFRFGATELTRLTLVRAKQVTLPDDLQLAGGRTLLAVRTNNFEKEPISGDIPGIRTTNLFLLDQAGQVVGPVGELATGLFDYTPPKDWADTSRGLYDSSAADDLSACIGY